MLSGSVKCPHLRNPEFTCVFCMFGAGSYRDAIRTSGLTKQEVAACLTGESTDTDSSDNTDAAAMCDKLRLMHAKVAMSKKQLKRNKSKENI